MDEEQKERLEKELRFLKESLEVDIISKEEYIKGKERIKKKLEELEENKEEEIIIKEVREDIDKEIIEESDREEDKGKEKEETDEVAFKEEEKKEEGVKEEKVISEEHKAEDELTEKREDIEDIKEEIGEKTSEDEKEEKAEDEPVVEKEEKKEKKPRKWLKWLRLIIIIILLYFLFKGCTEDTAQTIEEIKPACISDEDCQEAGKVGFCINPDTAEAKCEFKEAIKVNLVIVNDENCKSCDTGRMTQVIKQLFPGVKERGLHYNSQEGLELLKALDIEVLPTYIFDDNIAEAANFDKFKRALTKKEDKYLITPVASGADYYFKREGINNKLDLFVIEGANMSLKAERNVKDVLELFGNKIKFRKNVVSESENKRLSEELGITSFPVFLVNNQLKFGGVRSPEAVKQKFCELNDLEGCQTPLSENIK